MLGNIIKVRVEDSGRVAQGRYRVSRAALEQRVDGVSPYVLTVGVEPTAGLLTLRVIAVVPPSPLSPSMLAIAAPERMVLFEPQLRELIAPEVISITGEESFSLTCLHEKSCGAVVFRRRSGNTEFLLIKNKKGSNWGFPKGHIEAGETECETACREVLEETGVSITPLEGFRALSEYHPKGKIVKQVIFFIAEMNGDEITIQQSEIDRFVWADYGLAMRLFRFNNDRNVLTKARDWLRRH